jgi:hypothetical protein
VEALSGVTPKLGELKYIGTAVCTDNACNEITAVNPNHDDSVQTLAKLPMLRIPCKSQTINLAIEDLMTATKLETQ